MINILYVLFGKIFENAQYIEWNIALIVSKLHNIDATNLFEKMQDMTMGQILENKLFVLRYYFSTIKVNRQRSN